jgi:glutamate transport system permease protein
VTAVLYDAPGPRTRRRTLVASLIAGAAVLAGLAWLVNRLAAHGQFDAAMWQPVTDPDIQHTILIGLQATLKAAGLAIVCSIAFGALLAVGRLSEHGVVRVPSTVVVEMFRSLPLLLLILGLFFAFPHSLGALGALVLGLTLYNGSVLAEVFRAGIGAVPRGQREAAYALGMRKSQVMRLILLPQAVRTMLPALISQCVVALKDTALGYIITYPELLSSGKVIYQTYFNILPTAVVVGSMYVGLNMAVSAIATYLQRRTARGRRGPGAVAGPIIVQGQLESAVPQPPLLPENETNLRATR